MKKINKREKLQTLGLNYGLSNKADAWIDSIVQQVESCRLAHPNYFDFEIEEDSYYGEHEEWWIFGYREETDSEYESRMKKSKEDAERKEFERLKKKFEEVVA